MDKEPPLEIPQKKNVAQKNVLWQIIEWPRRAAACRMAEAKKKRLDKVICELCQSGFPRWQALKPCATCGQKEGKRHTKRVEVTMR